MKHSHDKVTSNILLPKRVYTVTGHEDFKSIWGFGPNEAKVEMMNQMMVEGSGMERMKMSPIQLDPAQTDPLEAPFSPPSGK